MRQQIEALVSQTLLSLMVEGVFSKVELPQDFIERPREKSHGDWASTIALKLSKALGKNPREIAETIAARIATDQRIAQIEVAGPGFINITLATPALQAEIIAAHSQGSNYARNNSGAGRRVNVEFISANPTGPMHVGHGRWAALGNALCNILEHSGWQVTREFYINDAGHQMDVFANSVLLRYRELAGEQINIPDEFYGGSYIKDIAQTIWDAEGDIWLTGEKTASAAAEKEPGTEWPVRLEHFRECAYQLMLEDMQSLCQRIEVPFDIWFSERTLYQATEAGISPIERMLERLAERGYLYEQDGATWFRATEFADDKDRVLVKSDGSYTYFCPDITYHLDKLERNNGGSEYLINIWGADHHGYVARMQAALAASGHPDCLRVLLGQLVNLYRAGEAVRMSKRTGEMVTFAELIDEVGADATKYLMLTRSSDQAIDFDIEAAKRADASNPVYYVQYAHARICSLLRKAEAQGLTSDHPLEASDLAGLVDVSELELARIFGRLEEVIESAARDLAPNRLTSYAEELAQAFHSFYTRCPVLTEERGLALARLCLAESTRSVLALVLGLIGVQAPERM
ncbi:MAG: arginine--tRNA ligase [Coriobacteriales bacterium]|jgi:arginyl-tRNA synthetase|nr:arginine--tRNA ligase [Coriobacteriales bacterium]